MTTNESTMTSLPAAPAVTELTDTELAQFEAALRQQRRFRRHQLNGLAKGAEAIRRTASLRQISDEEVPPSERPAFEAHLPHMIDRLQPEAHGGRLVPRSTKTLAAAATPAERSQQSKGDGPWRIH